MKKCGDCDLELTREPGEPLTVSKLKGNMFVRVILVEYLCPKCGTHYCFEEDTK